MRASEAGIADSGATERELVAYSRQTLGFIHEVLNIAARHSVQVIASVVDVQAPRPPADSLRKDYEYLFERYFYFLETLPPRERGLIVLMNWKSPNPMCSFSKWQNISSARPTDATAVRALCPNPSLSIPI